MPARRLCRIRSTVKAKQRKVCRTEREWHALAANTKEGIDELAAARNGGGQIQGNQALQAGQLPRFF
jgi:hypothetical protein